MTTTFKTLIGITALTGATTLRKCWIYDMMFGADGSPGDTVITYQADRQSTAGTGTAATPSLQETTDAASLMTVAVNHTAEPTAVSNSVLVGVPINQRASHRWVASPGGELVVPATTANGIGLRAKSPTYASTCAATVWWWE